MPPDPPWRVRGFAANNACLSHLFTARSGVATFTINTIIIFQTHAEDLRDLLHGERSLVGIYKKDYIV